MSEPREQRCAGFHAERAQMRLVERAAGLGGLSSLRPRSEGKAGGPCVLLGLGAGFPRPLLPASAGLGLPLEGFAVNALSGAWPALPPGVFFALGQAPGSRDLVPTRLRARPRPPLAVLSLCSWVEVGASGGSPRECGAKVWPP